MKCFVAPEPRLQFNFNMTQFTSQTAMSSDEEDNFGDDGAVDATGDYDFLESGGFARLMH